MLPRKFHALILLQMLIGALALTSVTHTAQAATAKITVEPSWSEFGNAVGDPILIPGSQVTVKVAVHDVSDVFGFDLKFRWNTVYLAYSSHVRTSAFELMVADTVDTVAGTYELAMARMGIPKPPGWGNYVWFFNITLDLIKQPYDYEQGTLGVDPIDITLGFLSTDISDSDAQPVEHLVEDATVRIWEKIFVLPPNPTVGVLPENSGGVLPGRFGILPVLSNFTVEIWIVEVDPFYDIAAFDIILGFDPVDFEATAISEGNYLKSYASSTFQVRSNIDNVEGTARYCLVQLLPRWGPGPASGTLFSVTFHVLARNPPSCNLSIRYSEIVLFPHPEPGPPPYYGVPWSVPLPHNATDCILCYGDVNNDGIVNIYDIVQACLSYGSEEGEPDWDAMPDYAPPWGIINIYDIVTIVSRYEQSP